MLYKKNKKSNSLDMELFKAPTSEYRAAPFWAWNCKLEKEELLWQIEQLKKMGFGGFHMHSRSGMSSPYLSEEFFDLVKGCTEKAEKENMLAYLYDEDRWSSGAAGGYVTKDPRFRQKFLCFSKEYPEGAVSPEEGNKTGKPYVLGCYDVVLTDGKLSEYKMLGEGEKAKGDKWYAYVRTPDCDGWFNGYTYVDVLSIDAMNKFIEITYEAYKNAVGDRFGESVPLIFTDEPNYATINQPAFSDSDEDSRYPWTYDFNDTYMAAYGESLIPKLPELRWEPADGRANTTRYRFLDHAAERFCRAFADNCGSWCSKNGLYFSGHVLCEENLFGQTRCVGEAMRLYRGFGIPGIDMLCNNVELSTAKQAQSATHQFGREGVLSELYGVTGWTFDFRGHKFQGDWQAALGVTVRVPHLSWVSMKGSAKRDYPASISYQSPWYEEYSYIEDHFARLNTALTRGKPAVNIGVIHPIESYWLTYGSNDKTGLERNALEDSFQTCVESLLFSTLDFDFLCESLLPKQQTKTEHGRLKVGEMSYSAVIVPNLKTMRSTTLEILKNFKDGGGKIIFIGDCPYAVDGVNCDDVYELYEQCEKLPTAVRGLPELLSEERFVSIVKEDGNSADSYIYNERIDGEDIYLFIARAKEDIYPDNICGENFRIIINGEFVPVILDTLDGGVKPAEYEWKGGKTVIKKTLFNHDSLLLKLTRGAADAGAPADVCSACADIRIDFKTPVKYRRCEDNVILLDLAEWKLAEDEAYRPVEELLRIDTLIRKEKKWPMADGCDVQPWMIEPEKISCFPELRFTFESEIEAECFLAFEEAEAVRLNGNDVSICYDGYFADKSIRKIRLPKLKKGENVLEVKVPIGKRISIESLYLLGDFDVVLRGTSKKICARTQTAAFGSITNQGMPFYGGNIEYEAEFETPDCDADITISRYRGALLKVSVDDSDEQRLVIAPYKVSFKGLKAGKHTLKITFFGNRHNTFGPLHMCDMKDNWIGPSAWYKSDDKYCYEYCLAETGVLSSPVIELSNVK
ncbi:MAG: hypothetical protein J6N52_09110 [Clostridia bacterium]|nr:hypothetical protein [Clostridia bacterium]